MTMDETPTAREHIESAQAVPTRRPYRDQIRHVAIDAIAPPTTPVRSTIDPTAVRELRVSLGQVGLLQLPGVRRVGRHRYELLWGQTRLLAARAAGWETIEVVLLEGVDDCAALILGVTENTTRRELPDVDKVRVVVACKAFGLTGKAIAEKTGISESASSRLGQIAEHLLLWPAVERGDIGVVEAQELLGVADTSVASLIAEIVRRRDDAAPLRVVAELRPLAAEARDKDPAPARTPRGETRARARQPKAAAPRVRALGRSIDRLVLAGEQLRWDDDALNALEALSAKLVQELPLWRARVQHPQPQRSLHRPEVGADPVGAGGGEVGRVA